MHLVGFHYKNDLMGSPNFDPKVTSLNAHNGTFLNSFILEVYGTENHNRIKRSVLVYSALYSVTCQQSVIT